MARARAGTAAGPGISTVELGRALLARQHLLHAAGTGGVGDVVGEISHLVGLQSQAPDPPYVGLWSRLEAFDPQVLSSLLVDRRVVRIALMRGTIHLVTSRDALLLHALLRPLFLQQLRTSTQHSRHLAALDLDDLAAAGRDALGAAPLTPAALGAVLAQRWSDVPPAALAQGVRGLLPLVQVPPRGLWGARGAGTSTRWTTAETWLGEDAPALDDPSERRAALAATVLRYLAAFGPATVADVQRWSGLTGLGAVIETIRPELVSLTGPDGREHLDVPEAPRPSADVPAPVRFLPEWDNLLLSHANRERVITESRRAAMFTSNGIVRASVLVDGQVVGRWRVQTSSRAATLTVELLDARLTRTQRSQTQAEGQRLLAFLAGSTPEHVVEIT